MLRTYIQYLKNQNLLQKEEAAQAIQMLATYIVSNTEAKSFSETKINPSSTTPIDAPVKRKPGRPKKV